MKKERWVNDNSNDTYRFDTIKNMSKKSLKIVMRNSAQIFELLEVTKKKLKKWLQSMSSKNKENMNTKQKKKMIQIKMKNIRLRNNLLSHLMVQKQH